MSVMEHETALDAIYEDPLYDEDDLVYEEGEIEERELAIECKPMEIEVPVIEEGIERRRPSPIKRSKKKSAGRFRKVNVSRFVRDMCHHLQETKISLMWEAVKKLGVDAIQDLVKEVDVIEKCGGQMVSDGKRRRTPGGVLWNIMKARVDPLVFKEIMVKGNEVQKQKLKENLKRQRMDVGDPMDTKRRRIEQDGSKDKKFPEVRMKNTVRSLHLPNIFKLSGAVIDAPSRDDAMSATVQLQKAWIEGVKRKDSMDGCGNGTGVSREFVNAVQNSGAEDKKQSVSERLRTLVDYDDIADDSAYQAVICPSGGIEEGSLGDSF